MQAIKRIVYLENMVRFVCTADTAQRRALFAELSAARHAAEEYRPYHELNALVRGA